MLLPALEFILVLNQILPHVSFNIWEYSYYFFEIVCAYVPYVRVSVSSYSGCPSLVGYESYLPEVITGGQHLDKDFALVLIVDVHIAIARGYEVKFASDLALLGNVLLWVVHLQLHSGKKHVLKLFIFVKHRMVLFYHILENEFYHLVL